MSGVPLLSILTYVLGTSNVQAVNEHLRDQYYVLHELRRNILIAQNRMKCQANQHRRDVSFDIGDYVYLKLQPYRQTLVAFQSFMKLALGFYVPYQVIAKVGSMSYKLTLPPDSQIHNVLHVSLLHKYLGSIPPTIAQLPPVSETATILPQPEAVIDHWVVHKGKYHPKNEILVKWVGAPVEDAIWENIR